LCSCPCYRRKLAQSGLNFGSTFEYSSKSFDERKAMLTWPEKDGHGCHLSRQINNMPGVPFLGCRGDALIVILRVVGRRRRNCIIPAISGRSDDLYTRQHETCVFDTKYDSRLGWIWQVSCKTAGRMRSTEQQQQASPDSQQGTP
jgi:hypothetical protein